MSDLFAFLAEALISLMLISGGLFALLGSGALIKLRAPMQRLHGPTLTTTLGVGMTLVASIFALVLNEHPLTLDRLLVILVLLIAAPIVTLYLAKVVIFMNIAPEELPSTGTSESWATLAPDQKPDRGEEAR